MLRERERAVYSYPRSSVIEHERRERERERERETDREIERKRAVCLL